MTRHLVY